MPAIRVLIADEQRLFRLGLARLLEAEPDLALAGDAADTQTALALARQQQPDVALLDVGLPPQGGVVATRRLLDACPETRVLLMARRHDDRYLLEAVRAGARGYLLAEAGAGELVDAIRRVARGEAALPPALTGTVLDGLTRRAGGSGVDAPQSLTPGEMEVLALVASGASNRQIAERLVLAEKTVINRLSSVYQKLGVRGRTQAALYALRQGWVDLDRPP